MSVTNILIQITENWNRCEILTKNKNLERLIKMNEKMFKHLVEVCKKLYCGEEVFCKRDDYYLLSTDINIKYNVNNNQTHHN